MNWDALQILRQNVVAIVDNTLDRCGAPSSADRDMREVIAALGDTIQDNNSLSIDHLNRMVRRKSLTYQTEYTNNLALYKDALKSEIRRLLSKNEIDVSVSNLIDSALDILHANLARTEQDWSLDWLQRRNYKNFDPSIQVPAYLEKRLDIILENVPIQSSGIADFRILKLKQSEEDRIIRDHLFQHFYYNGETDYHEIMIINSPLAYFFIPQKTLYQDWTLYMLSHGIHMGLHGGACLAETIAQGYDCSFIGCSDAVSKEADHQWRDMLVEKTGDTDYHDVDDCWPMLSIHIGKWNNLWHNNSIEKTHICSNGIEYKYKETLIYEDRDKGNIFI